MVLGCHVARVLPTATQSRVIKLDPAVACITPDLRSFRVLGK